MEGNVPPTRSTRPATPVTKPWTRARAGETVATGTSSGDQTPAIVPKTPAIVPKTPATVRQTPATVPKTPATVLNPPATVPNPPATVPT